MPSDDELLARYRARRDRGDLDGARQAWEQLAVANHDRVRQLVKLFRFPGGAPLPPASVDDATQEALLRVMAMGAAFRESAPGQFRAALRQCVTNACLDFGRRELRHDRRAAGSLDEGYEEGGGSPYDAAIARASLDAQAEAEDAAAAEERRALARDLVAWGIGQVENDRYREVLEMTYGRRLAADEIVERLGITLDNVYARRSRGVKRLEAILRDLGPRTHP